MEVIVEKPKKVFRPIYIKLLNEEEVFNLKAIAEFYEYRCVGRISAFAADLFNKLEEVNE